SHLELSLSPFSLGILSGRSWEGASIACGAAAPDGTQIMAGASSPWPWGRGLRNWLASLLLCVSPEMPPGGHVRSSKIWRVIQTVDAGCTKPVWAYVSSQFLVERAGWSACRVSLTSRGELACDWR